MHATQFQSRRSFMKLAAGAAIAGFIRPISAFGLTPISNSFADFQKKLVGPIYSNPCPFTADLKLDDAGQQKAIARALKHGVGVFAATAGNTKYSTLSFDEAKQVNRVMIEAVGGKALTIAATGDWETEQAIAFAKEMQSVGADAIQVMRPQKFKEDEDGAVSHFAAVAKATDRPIVLHGHFSDELLARLVKIESVAAMKEDAKLDDFIRQQIDHGNRIVMFGGGGENRIYVGWPYGANAYYSTYTTFAPKIPMQIWEIIKTGDIRKAAAMTAKYDYPFIRRFTHPMWHATLEIFNLSTRHVRPPHKTFTDEQMEELKQFFAAQGVSPADYD